MESFNVNKVNQLQMNISVDLTQHLCKQDMKNHLPSCYHIQAMFKEPLRKCFPLNVHLNVVLLRSSRLWQLPSAKSVFSFLCYQVRLVYSVVHWFLVFVIIDHSKSRLFLKKTILFTHAQFQGDGTQHKSSVWDSLIAGVYFNYHTISTQFNCLTITARWTGNLGH